jgi:hypothetical protein
VELRQAPWILWIDDLSAKDPYFVLPILMGITMFVQQKLNPAPVDPIQAKVMTFLPIVFTFFFLFFPSVAGTPRRTTGPQPLITTRVMYHCWMIDRVLLTTQ